MLMDMISRNITDIISDILLNITTDVLATNNAHAILG